jgi:hypothetical protein
MSASGYTPISLYYSTTASASPVNTNLTNGELAINITDGKLFYKDNGGTVQVIGWKTTPATAGGTGQTTYATGDLLYASATNTLSKLAAGTNGYVLTLASGVPTWAASTGGVTSFSAGTTGFTPNTGTTGAITLAGTLATTNGGTGLTTFTSGGAVYATSTSVLATGTLPNTAGGTGQSSAFTQYGITYASSTTALATTAAGTSTTVLHGNASGAPTFGAVSLTADVTGTLPIANGGTGLTSTPTNGQIDIGNGTGFTRTTLTAGSNITITNGSGTITIASTGGGGSTSIGLVRAIAINCILP